jgi:hypothetical protein
MAQNRKPPAFQEYASSIIASRQFRLMTLAERGLYYTLRLECWVNVKAPSSLKDLAKYLGFDISEIEASLTENVKSLFIDENGSFSCPELDNYRNHLEGIKSLQSEGGKRGSAITNAKRNKSTKPVNTSVSSTPSSDSQVPCRAGVDSLVQLSTVKQSQEQSLENGVYHNQWVNDYDHASNGE